MGSLSEVDHECVVVHDFNTSASAFARFFGRAAPVGHSSPKVWQYYRGRLNTAQAVLDKVPIGEDFKLEVLQPTDRKASFYSELLDAKGNFLNHIGAHITEDFDTSRQRIEALGCQTLQIAQGTGFCLAYMDARSHLG